jgi:hypothetical protein
VVAAILPKMATVRCAARKIGFGSATYYGLGLDHLVNIQNFSSLKYIIGRIRIKSITSTPIRHRIDYTQLESG